MYQSFKLKRINVFLIVIALFLIIFPPVMSNLLAQTNIVEAITWKPDGSRLATANSDGTIRILDAVSGNLLQTFQGHTREVFSVAWSPDDNRLASGAVDGTVRIWDANSGQQLILIQVLPDGHAIFSVAWSPDGSKVASSSDDNSVDIWNASNGQILRGLDEHLRIVEAIAWSPDGTKLASGSWDTTIRIWNTTTGQVLLTSGANEIRAKIRQCSSYEGEHRGASDERGAKGC